MQDTGIVRRIDDLGRVVIPKEIRKTLRIKQGDPLMIFADREQLVFKKYSPISSIKEYATAVAEGIFELTGKPCAITDTDNVIYVSCSKDKDIVNKPISQDIVEALKNRKSLLINKAEGGKILSIVKGDFDQMENQIIVPITSGGDCYGSVILYDKEKNQKFTSEQVKFVSLGANLLSKQF